VTASAQVLSRAAKIQACVFDVDGVLTDGALWYGPSGEALKRFDVRDGHGMVLARLTGLKVCLLTARVSTMVETRAAELKLTRVVQGARDKGQGLIDLAAELGLPLEALSYMGDDVNDVPALRLAGLATCPADAVAESVSVSHWVSQRPGGHGAARELLELVLRATGRWDAALNHMK
jgi:3-deoxy-D-manno-octulosonate 8-phosphate phosphatase (KDO 8-P phosphatase)